MTPRERVINALEMRPVDRVPRQLWALPGVTMHRRGEYERIVCEHPSDFAGPDVRYGRGRKCSGAPYEVGSYTDAWGCVWHVGEPGVAGEVKEYVLGDWAALDAYRPPWELLDDADFSGVNKSCHATDRFVLAGTETRPFERMQFLRGTENLMIDLAYGTAEVARLRDMLHDFNMREMRMWADTDVDGVMFMDDWGSQKSLLISPALWREFYKPMYRDYCDILRGKGKYAFFHSDGNIESIFPDLIEIGVNAVNSQLFCMDIEELGRSYAGKIAIWGEIDRQRILPFGSAEEVRGAVRRVAGAFMRPGRTGVIAQCEWGVHDPAENIGAVFDEWDRV